MDKKISDLYTEYYKKFWELDDNSEALTDEQLDFMGKELHRQFLRDYFALDGDEGIEEDKRIEKLKIRREKELEELRLKCEQQSAEFERRRYIQNKEAELQKQIADGKYEVKAEEIVPKNIKRRWWQLRERPNYAKELALREVGLDIEEYYAEIESALEGREGNSDEIVTILKRIIPAPRKRRKRRHWEERLKIIAAAYENMRQHKKEAEEQLEQIIQQADEQTGAEAFDEPKSCEVIQERESVRVVAISAAKPTKPKRKRTRRIPPQQENEEMQGGQVEGQIGMEELKQNEEQAPGNADKPEEGDE